MEIADGRRSRLAEAHAETRLPIALLASLHYCFETVVHEVHLKGDPVAYFSAWRLASTRSLQFLVQAFCTQYKQFLKPAAEVSYKTI